jgi:hypothetical protein
MWKKMVIAVLAGSIFLSCVRNANSVKTADTADRETPDNQASNILVYQPEEASIRDLLHTQAERATRLHESILTLKKVNFGIPGGDNWLAEWVDQRDTSTLLLLYLIKDDVILKYYNLGLNYNKDSERVKSRYDIMRDIPGFHIGNGCSSIGDFNGDGLDEVFQYVFGGNGNFIFIIGYDADNDKLVYYCDIPFDIIDPENGPAPVEFMTYKGMEGFKVYYYELNVAGGPSEPPNEPNPDNKRWFFYTWDETRREYITVEEVVE